MIVLDHNTPQWVAKQKNTNGAETYSKDLVRYQIPHWHHVLSHNDIISVCPRFNTVIDDQQHDLAVQYMHTYPFRGPIRYVRDIQASMLARAKSMIFVTAYEAYAKRLQQMGIKAVFIPMSIDARAVERFRGKTSYGYKRLLWFGNIYKAKIETFKLIRAACARKGIRLDVLARDHYNGQRVTQEQVLPIVARYRQCIAVGRCALEAYALGLKVMIAGNGVGGLVMSDEDAEAQIRTNFNGRVNTFSLNIDKCLATLPNSLTGFRFDIRKMNHAKIVMESLKK